ncbi:hypothetical protein [Microbacterium arborescens]|uniref:hypothetical protein n=1 Tax=Microbacterium arborescens TaxID=33883 RepID=UPI0027D8DA54|nr:hypothetical protein [Microbacterium arborescens]
MSEEEFAKRFTDCLISEIKAEMGRRDLSSRGLGRLIGKSSQYMSDRLDGGSSKTGQRVVLNVWDLVAISEALGLDAADLTKRAESAARGGTVIHATFGDVRGAGEDKRAVAKKKGRDRGEDADT